MVVPGFAAPAPERSLDMERMIQDIEAMTEETAWKTGRARLAKKVLEAMRKVPREDFVRPDDRHRAYVNHPMPIGEGQTISQPFIVALMTDLLDVERGDRVLEVGTGSGYQAAVLAELSDTVYSIEIVPELARRSKKTLDKLGYKIHTRLGDGYHGWREAAPFDAVIVTAAAPEIPAPLLEQLAPGGRMVIPVKKSAFSEQLMLIVRRADGSLETTEVLPVRFVPLTGEH